MAGRYPFAPFPRGWYHVLDAQSLPPRGVAPLRACGRDFVLFRTHGGRIAALDAHCAHQGAHLGYGGVVHGESVKCPFHGWRFDAAGRCVGAPAAPGATEAPRAALRAWTVAELDGAVLLWFDADGGPPASAPPAVAERGAPGWTLLGERTWLVRSHVREVIENLVDAAHFQTLHKTPSLPTARFEADGDRARIAMQLDMASLAGPVATHLASEGTTLGYWVLRFEGIAPVTVLTTATPIEEELVSFRLVFYGRGELEHARAFAKSVEVQVDQDQRIWEHKVYRADPPLTAADGPIAAYRAWCERFEPRAALDDGAAAAAG
jgi:nitrite reductase/ring-hydroxylating ferredoxin subunit